MLQDSRKCKCSEALWSSRYLVYCKTRANVSVMKPLGFLTHFVLSLALKCPLAAVGFSDALCFVSCS